MLLHILPWLQLSFGYCYCHALQVLHDTVMRSRHGWRDSDRKKQPPQVLRATLKDSNAPVIGLGMLQADAEGVMDKLQELELTCQATADYTGGSGGQGGIPAYFGGGEDEWRTAVAEDDDDSD